MRKVLFLCLGVFLCICLNCYAENVKINPEIEIYFTFKDDCSKILSEKMDKAKKSIYFCTYSLTDPYISAALIRAKKRGIAVSGVTEKQNAAGKGAKFKELKDAGVDIYLDDNSALMHHKFVVIDDFTIGTGSFNWTKNANEKNNENLVFMQGKEAAELFYKEYNSVYWNAKYEK